MYIRCGNFGTGMSSSLMAVEYPYPQASAVPIQVACKYMQLIPRLLDSMNSLTHLWGSLHVQKLSPSNWTLTKAVQHGCGVGSAFLLYPPGIWARHLSELFLLLVDLMKELAKWQVLSSLYFS